MEELIKKLYKSYGTYVNTSKMVPSSIDGTIPIWKRLLLGAHTIARNEFVKSATVFGYVIGHWHPHSEAIQSTAQYLVNNGFLEGKGNWGSDIGVEPTDCAAPRYTSLKINKFIDELCFKYINDVEWVPSELEPEPLYLPTPIPICLFSKTDFVTIGFGIKIEIPCYRYTDLVNRLKYLLKMGNKVTIEPYIKNCKILSSKTVLEKLLTQKGKHTIDIQGVYHLDKNNYRIYVKGWSPRISFESLFNRINKEMNNEVTYVDESNEKDGTNVRIELIRTRNKSELFEKLVKVVDDKLRAKHSYHIYGVTPDNKKVVELSVDEYLLNSYNYYCKTIDRFIERKKLELKRKIDDFEILNKLKKHVSDLDIRNKEQLEKSLTDISKKIEVDKEELRRIIKEYHIESLITTKVNIDQTKNELKSLDAEKLKKQFIIDCEKN